MLGPPQKAQQGEEWGNNDYNIVNFTTTHFIFVDTPELCSKEGCKGTKLIAIIRAATFTTVLSLDTNPHPTTVYIGVACAASLVSTGMN